MKESAVSIKLKSLPKNKFRKEISPEKYQSALRTAFISRFIVLREGRRSRAHRAIEELTWSNQTTAEELYKLIRQAFIKNGDKLSPVDRDLRRAMEHARTSVDYFIEQYSERNVLNFKDALNDYERSNRLLFGDDSEVIPRTGGWRLNEETMN